MVITTLNFLVSLSASGLIYYYSGLWSVYYYFWLPIILIPILFVSLFGLDCIILYIWSKFININKPIEKPNMFFSFLVDEIAYLIDILSNTSIKTKGKEKYPSVINQKCLIVYNHQSNFDPMCIMKVFPYQKIVYITKPEIEKIPIAGPFVHKRCNLKINRNSIRESFDTFNKAIDLIKNNIASICVAPEGTRSKTGDLLPFHAAVFKIATSTNCPIVIINLKNTRHIHKNFPFRHTFVKFDIIDVLYEKDYHGLTATEVSNLVRNKYLTSDGGVKNEELLSL